MTPAGGLDFLALKTPIIGTYSPVQVFLRPLFESRRPLVQSTHHQREVCHVHGRSRLKHANDNNPRLLTKTQAATYCGLSIPTFGSVCPVRPIALGVGVRMERYDVRDIDAWIDSLKPQSSNLSMADALLDAL